MARLTNREAINNARKDILDILNDLESTISKRTKTTSNKKSSKVTKNSKANVIAMLKAGDSLDTVAAANPAFTRGQISAFKAHITMGNL